MIIFFKGKKKNHNQTSGPQCKCSSPRPLFLNPDWPPSQVTPPSLHTIYFIGHGTILWCAISLWSIRFACPGYAVSQFAFCLTNLLTGRV